MHTVHRPAVLESNKDKLNGQSKKAPRQPLSWNSLVAPTFVSSQERLQIASAPLVIQLLEFFIFESKIGFPVIWIPTT